MHSLRKVAMSCEQKGILRNIAEMYDVEFKYCLPSFFGCFEASERNQTITEQNITDDSN
jgi:hypothetical protein